jgi:hypothetical protein
MRGNILPDASGPFRVRRAPYNDNKKQRVGTMNVTAEMYIVISLMFAVFAAVAAVGTSIVLGAGFERLRAGFEIIRKQTGFFADAIHKLDERTQEISAETGKLREAVNGMGDRVERVEKTTGFFSDAIHSLEQQILAGGAVTVPDAVHNDHSEAGEPVLSHAWITAGEDEAMTSDTDYLLGNLHTLLMPERPDTQQWETPELSADTAEQARTSRLPDLLMSYFRTETRGDVSSGKEVVFH